MPFDLSVENAWKPEDYPDPDGTLNHEFVAEHDEMRRQWLSAVGFHPAQHVWINASSRHRINSLILGRIALTLAQRYDGWIDLNGAIIPPQLFPRLEDFLNPSPESLIQIHEYVTSTLPGRVAEMYYTAYAGYKWVSHKLDVEAFEAWLRHPDFHLVS
jgi:hypothetical protein